MQTFVRECPQEESKDDNENSGAIYDAIGQLLEDYLTREVAVDKEVQSITAVIDKTED